MRFNFTIDKSMLWTNIKEAMRLFAVGLLDLIGYVLVLALAVEIFAGLMGFSLMDVANELPNEFQHIYQQFITGTQVTNLEDYDWGKSTDYGFFNDQMSQHNGAPVTPVPEFKEP